MTGYFLAELTYIVYPLLERDGSEQKGTFFRGKQEANIVSAHVSTIEEVEP